MAVIMCRSRERVAGPLIDSHKFAHARRRIAIITIIAETMLDSCMVLDDT